ncbi:hypothetical protein EG349_10290 [Chryseobacterium shandongense]|uniref:DUF1804 family protein n=2 Tax=Chryseobacterium TaxID=59732 RepID=A0AAD0YES8_9FLAO|nr:MULTISPECIES: hypothetical protein [Chryseobacterium]AZA87148.1 hypothetical protein EG349_10290 [Chryseobacterium shandongense]AZA95577.1 hypothetical protein EG353_08365 [Chryseobacterium shandongense]MEC3876143.1 hypothetical protein [Chryseobacterium sp. T9W2-O]
MAKQEQKNLAFFYFTEERMEAKEIATKLKVRPNTVGDWIKNGNWKQIRDSKINQSGQRLDRIQQVIDDLAVERLDIMKKIKEYPQQIRELEKEIREVSNKNIQVELKTQVAELKGEEKDLKRQTVFIDQGIAMWNKTLANFHTENKITLTRYIEIQEKIFNAMREYDEKLYMKTLDFQHEHILHAATQYN